MDSKQQPHQQQQQSVVFSFGLSSEQASKPRRLSPRPQKAPATAATAGTTAAAAATATSQSATVYGYSYSLVLLQSVAAYSEGKTAALLLYAYSCVSLYLGLLIQFYEEKAQSGFCSAVLVLVMCTYTQNNDAILVRKIFSFFGGSDLGDSPVVAKSLGNKCSQLTSEAFYKSLRCNKKKVKTHHGH